MVLAKGAEMDFRQVVPPVANAGSPYVKLQAVAFFAESLRAGAEDRLVGRLHRCEDEPAFDTTEDLGGTIVQILVANDQRPARFEPGQALIEVSAKSRDEKVHDGFILNALANDIGTRVSGGYEGLRKSLNVPVPRHELIVRIAQGSGDLDVPAFARASSVALGQKCWWQTADSGKPPDSRKPSRPSGSVLCQ